MKKQVEGLKSPDKIITEEEVKISRIEDLPDSEEKPSDFQASVRDSESDITISIIEDGEDDNDIKITVKEDSYISENNDNSETEEIAKYKFPTF